MSNYRFQRGDSGCLLQIEPVRRYGRHSGVARQLHLSVTRFGNRNRGRNFDNSGRLPALLAETGESCGARGFSGFLVAFVHTGDVGDQALQETCNLFGPLTVATITQSKKPTSLGMRPGSAPNDWKAARRPHLDCRKVLDLPSITHQHGYDRTRWKCARSFTRSQAQLRKVL
jgi:hypothetical protein